MSEPRRKLSISVPELPWEVSDKEMTAIENCASLSSPPPPDRSNLSVNGGGASGDGELATTPPDIKAWEEARRQAHINSYLRQAEQDR